MPFRRIPKLRIHPHIQDMVEAQTKELEGKTFEDEGIDPTKTEVDRLNSLERAYLTHVAKDKPFGMQIDVDAVHFMQQLDEHWPHEEEAKAETQWAPARQAVQKKIWGIVHKFMNGLNPGRVRFQIHAAMIPQPLKPLPDAPVAYGVFDVAHGNIRSRILPSNGEPLDPDGSPVSVGLIFICQPIGKVGDQRPWLLGIGADPYQPTESVINDNMSGFIPPHSYPSIPAPPSHGPVHAGEALAAGVVVAGVAGAAAAAEAEENKPTGANEGGANGADGSGELAAERTGGALTEAKSEIMGHVQEAETLARGEALAGNLGEAGFLANVAEGAGRAVEARTEEVARELAASEQELTGTEPLQTILTAARAEADKQESPLAAVEQNGLELQGQKNELPGAQEAAQEVAAEGVTGETAAEGAATETGVAETGAETDQALQQEALQEESPRQVAIDAPAEAAEPGEPTAQEAAETEQVQAAAETGGVEPREFTQPSEESEDHPLGEQIQDRVTEEMRNDVANLPNEVMEQHSGMHEAAETMHHAGEASADASPADFSTYEAAHSAAIAAHPAAAHSVATHSAAGHIGTHVVEHAIEDGAVGVAAHGVAGHAAAHLAEAKAAPSAEGSQTLAEHIREHVTQNAVTGGAVGGVSQKATAQKATVANAATEHAATQHAAAQHAATTAQVRTAQTQEAVRHVGQRAAQDVAAVRGGAVARGTVARTATKTAAVQSSARPRRQAPATTIDGRRAAGRLAGQMGGHAAQRGTQQAAGRHSPRMTTPRSTANRQMAKPIARPAKMAAAISAKAAPVKVSAKVLPKASPKTSRPPVVAKKAAKRSVVVKKAARARSNKAITTQKAALKQNIERRLGPKVAPAGTRNVLAKKPAVRQSPAKAPLKNAARNGVKTQPAKMRAPAVRREPPAKKDNFAPKRVAAVAPRPAKAPTAPHLPERPHNGGEEPEPK